MCRFLARTAAKAKRARTYSCKWSAIEHLSTVKNRFVLVFRAFEPFCFLSDDSLTANRVQPGERQAIAIQGKRKKAPTKRSKVKVGWSGAHGAPASYGVSCLPACDRLQTPYQLHRSDRRADPRFPAAAKQPHQLQENACLPQHPGPHG